MWKQHVNTVSGQGKSAPKSITTSKGNKHYPYTESTQEVNLFVLHRVSSDFMLFQELYDDVYHPKGKRETKQELEVSRIPVEWLM